MTILWYFDSWMKYNKWQKFYTQLTYPVIKVPTIYTSARQCTCTSFTIIDRMIYNITLCLYLFHFSQIWNIRCNMLINLRHHSLNKTLLRDNIVSEMYLCYLLLIHIQKTYSVSIYYMNLIENVNCSSNSCH